jgi:transcriptional regulator with XRE-family HTH domain
MDHSPRHKRFCALLRLIRQEAGFSQGSLAAKLDKPQSFVSKTEIGERRIGYLELRDFCAACDLSVSEFDARFEKGERSVLGRSGKRRLSDKAG